MENYNSLIELLEKSVKKNGEKPLTNKWLLNLLKILQREIDKEDNLIGTFDPFWD